VIFSLKYLQSTQWPILFIKPLSLIESSMVFSFNNTSHCSFWIPANTAFKQETLIQPLILILDHHNFRTAKRRDLFYQVYWSAFNIYKSASFSNKELVYHWSYFLTFKSPRTPIINIYKNLMSVPSFRRGRNRRRAWRTAKKGGGLAAPERAS